MPGLYIDTSAVGRVALGEADAPAIRATLAQYEPWYSSELLIVELRRLGKLADVEAAAEQILALVTFTPLPRTALESASRIDPIEVRTLDAIHLAAAARLHDSGIIDAMLTFDHQLQAGCQFHGIAVEAPIG